MYIIFKLYVCLCVCVCGCVHIWVYTQEFMYPLRPEEGVRSPVSGVTGGYEPPNTRNQEVNSGPLEEQFVLLTAKSHLFMPWIFNVFLILSITDVSIEKPFYIYLYLSFFFHLVSFRCLVI